MDVSRAHGLAAGKRAGYSVGIGFPPTWMEAEIIALKRDDPTVLHPGMVFHIVPALREAGQFAVGCSETVLVTENGVEVLTKLERSEEHTSELQSLMRISYAVFCLKHKKQQHKTTMTEQT